MWVCPLNFLTFLTFPQWEAVFQKKYPKGGGGGKTQKTLNILNLVARIARHESLAIWHRGRSHRRPNRSGSPNRRHFASLDLKKHPDFSHRSPTSQDFRRRFFLHFRVISFRSSECVFASLAKKTFFASLVIRGCAIRIASHIAVASRDLGH